MGTAKGFTGQYNDSVSGLDYYNARYYDPTVAVFLSADVMQGNGAGINPYEYVGGNPETWSDPTGQFYAPPRGGGRGGGVGGPVGGGGGVTPGGSSGVTPYWPPPGGLGPDACQVYGCKQVANLDTGSLHGGTTCSPVAMGELAELTCTSPPPQGSSSGNSGGDWVWVNRPPIQVTLCTLGFNCSDESTGPDEGGASKVDVLASDEGGATRTAQIREELGIPARSLNPDDGQTLAILQADGKEFWGTNGRKSISIQVNAISKDHAEIDALNQLYIDRQTSGVTGGQGVMWVDRPPCSACGINGGIRSAVRAVGLDALEVYFGPGIDKAGGFIPGDIMLIKP